MTRVVGFAGGSGSGKTTVARHVAERLGLDRCSVVSLDDFYHPLPEAFRDNPEAYNFDAPEALDVVALLRSLKGLRAGESVEIPVYDFPSHSRKGSQRVPARPWLILDGILTLALEPVRSQIDVSFFLEVPESVRLERRILRDQRIRGRSLREILEQYFATVRPMHERHVAPSRVHATKVLDGTRSVGDLAEIVMAALLDRFGPEAISSPVASPR